MKRWWKDSLLFHLLHTLLLICQLGYLYATLGMMHLMQNLLFLVPGAVLLLWVALLC